jgi:hypothetical protein
VRGITPLSFIVLMLISSAGVANDPLVVFTLERDGARLDRLAVTEDTGFVPTGIGQ